MEDALSSLLPMYRWDIHRIMAVGGLSYLHGISASPLPSRVVVPGPVRLVDMCDFRDQRVVGVGVSEQGADGEQDLADGQGRTPLVLQDVQADGAVGVDVRVVNARDEVDLGRLEGVVRRELNV